MFSTCDPLAYKIALLAAGRRSNLKPDIAGFVLTSLAVTFAIKPTVSAKASAGQMKAGADFQSLCAFMIVYFHGPGIGLGNKVDSPFRKKG